MQRPAPWRIIWLFASMIALSHLARGEVIAVYSSPGLEPEKAIVGQIDMASESILYQMYNFTSPEISDALKRAHDRGVKVSILLDATAASQASCQGGRMAAAGVPVFVDRCSPRHPIAHNKNRVVDGRLLMCGSYNDTRNARENAELLLLIDTAWVVARVREQFNQHLSHAIPWKQHVAEMKARQAVKANRTPRRVRR